LYFAIDPKFAFTSSCFLHRRADLDSLCATATSVSEVQAIFSISPLRVKTLMEAKSNCKCFLQFCARDATRDFFWIERECRDATARFIANEPRAIG